MKVKIDIPDLNRKLNSMKLYAVGVEAKTNKHILTTAVLVQARSKRNLTANKSVITGNLRNTMDFTHSVPKIEAAVGTNTFYGKFVEAKKPFLVPAAISERATFLKGFKGIVKP